MKKGVTDLISEIKRGENYPESRAPIMHIIQHGLQGFIVRNIEGGKRRSMEVNDLSHIL